MPLKTWNTKADFDKAYSFGAEGLDGHPNTRPEVRLHYHRSMMGGATTHRAHALRTILGPAQLNARILIVGGGFGWLADEMRKKGFTNLLVTDTSAYIQAEKDNDDVAELRDGIVAAGLDPNRGRGAELLTRHRRTGGRRGTEQILNADICKNGGRTAISGILGDPQIVVTESVLESLTDAEITELSRCAHSFPPPQDVYHLVYTLAVGGYNSKTLAEWKALIPADTLIDAVTFEVLV